MDSILGIGMNELIIIFLIAGIILGPERMLRLAREAGKLIRNVKNYFKSLTDELKGELDIVDEIKSIKKDILK